MEIGTTKVTVMVYTALDSDRSAFKIGQFTNRTVRSHTLFNSTRIGFVPSVVIRKNLKSTPI